MAKARLAILEKKLLERNISLIYIIGSLMWMRFFVPVLALFYIASQVPVEQFAVIMAVFALATLVLEVPSGVLADLLGRKKTLLLARGMWIIEIAMLAFFNGFWPFLIAKVISGIGVSLSSGTASALMYETLKKLKREKEHTKISGNLYTITSISMAFVFIIGAFLFSINHKLPAYVSLPLVSLGFILTFFIHEPYHYKHKVTIKKSTKHLFEGIKHFFENKKLIALTVYSVPIAAVISITLSMSSVFLAMVLIPLSLMGVVAFIGSMLTAYGSKNAHAFEKKIGERKSLAIIQITIIVSTLLMLLIVPYVGVLFYLLIPLITGFFGVLLNNYMNHHVKQSHRATMLSINNMGENIGIFILFPIVGYVTKNITLSHAYGIMLLILLIGALVSTTYFRKLHIV